MWFTFLIITVASLALIRLILHASISWQEWTVQAVVCTFITLSFVIVDHSYGDSYDYEVWNAEITNKIKRTEQCPYGWRSSRDSFCSEYRTREVFSHQTCTVVDKVKSCTDHYDTEYKYLYDSETRWYIEAAGLNRSWEIARADRRGAIEPEFYTSVNKGDPASMTNSYRNWVRAATDSIFHQDGKVEEKYKDRIPRYPIEMYDLFKVNRIVLVGVDLKDYATWNYKLASTLKDLGPQKQMNAVVVLVDANKFTQDYPYAVRRAWKGFKKNDAVVFIGVNPSDMKVVWGEVMSWSKKSIFNIELRDSILEGVDKTLDLDTVFSNLHDIGMLQYERRSMKEFEFLKDQIPPNYTMLTIIAILQAIFLACSTIFFHRKDF